MRSWSYIDLKVLSRTQALNSMKICSLSPLSPMGRGLG
ncbi:hypothetical protein FX983_03272 [Pseudomonas frederiksbergensis]|uniref:Uncharacterized protein n=1 Tax=Pseudomonas frederiksbergensis TaxID=104087 RepID=A0A6L5C3W1_9PSED|nr:hypothetical protein FX983_03272 [Pseudomonas frederiksbergensis]